MIAHRTFVATMSSASRRQVVERHEMLREEAQAFVNTYIPPERVINITESFGQHYQAVHILTVTVWYREQ